MATLNSAAAMLSPESSTEAQICRICWEPNTFLTVRCGHPFCVECICTFYNTFCENQPDLEVEDQVSGIRCPYCRQGMGVGAQMKKKEGQWTFYCLTFNNTPFYDYVQRKISKVCRRWLKQCESRPDHTPVTLTVVLDDRLDWPTRGWNTMIGIEDDIEKVSCLVRKPTSIATEDTSKLAKEPTKASAGEKPATQANDDWTVVVTKRNRGRGRDATTPSNPQPAPELDSSSRWQYYEVYEPTEGPAREVKDDDGIPWALETYLDIDANDTTDLKTWVLTKSHLEQQLRDGLAEVWRQIRVPEGENMPPEDHPVWEELADCGWCNNCYICWWFADGAGDDVAWAYRQMATARDPDDLSDDAESEDEYSDGEASDGEGSDGDDDSASDDSSEWDTDDEDSVADEGSEGDSDDEHPAADEGSELESDSDSNDGASDHEGSHHEASDSDDDSSCDYDSLDHFRASLGPFFRTQRTLIATCV